MVVFPYCVVFQEQESGFEGDNIAQLIDAHLKLPRYHFSFDSFVSFFTTVFGDHHQALAQNHGHLRLAVCTLTPMKH